MSDNHHANFDVFITGFGPFANIKINPSSAIAKYVAEQLKGRVRNVYFRELETSIVATTAYFDEITKEIEDMLSRDSKLKIVLFHIGVHSKEKEGIMRVETCGFNELTASVPDVNGVMFNEDAINADDGPITVSHESWFGKTGSAQEKLLEKAVQDLNDAIKQASSDETTVSNAVDVGGASAGALHMPTFQQPQWTVSRDAGRYLCNCVLYCSTKFQDAHLKRVFAVFVHVCDPQQGTEAPGASNANAVAAYNPSLMTQREQVLRLMYLLLEIAETA